MPENDQNWQIIIEPSLMQKKRGKSGQMDKSSIGLEANFQIARSLSFPIHSTIFRENRSYLRDVEFSAMD